MKKYFPFLAFLFIITLVSCEPGATGSKDSQSKQPAKEKSREGDKVSKNKADGVAVKEFNDKFALDSHDANSPMMNIKISLPFANGDDERAKKINREIAYAALDNNEENPETAIDMYVDARKNDFNSLYPDYVNVKNMGESTFWPDYNYEISGEFIPSREGLICCKINKVVFEGGPHGLESTYYVTFDSKSGKEVTLDDIFKENYNEELCSLLVDAFVKQLGVSSFDEVREMGFFEDMDLYATSNFHINDKGITFHYNRYDIAPYAAGESVVTIGLDKLKNILK
ncbi:MAG: DUF3298 domain-containing protein [Bacteroidaceae bacterium]|nr:DUF3298 domain-containing protein [Bacteroidaceae bacterium]